MRRGRAGRHVVVMAGAVQMRVMVLTVRVVSATNVLVAVAAGRGMVTAGVTTVGAIERMVTMATLGVGWALGGEDGR